MKTIIEVNTFRIQNGDLIKSTVDYNSPNVSKTFNGLSEDAKVLADRAGGSVDITRIGDTELIIDYIGCFPVTRRHLVVIP